MTETAHTEQRDYIGAKLGMWFFLFTEVLLFGGMFLVYSVYREVYTADFHEAGMEMNVVIGAVNTVILLTSSLTMALSISAIKKGAHKISVLLQAATVLLGIAFLVNKYFEWSDHIRHGFYPDSPQLLAMSHGKILFFGLYYVMTGIHALHVLIGVSIITFILVLTLRGTVTSNDYIKLENAGLFWHLVDVIWIYLFPLFYLIL
ncbi:MAG TPA: cytochrome c oxidase subunit 3 family protein [Nitrospirota bacterium]|nr:cytochrome c oxidase subunit 3 family protein [Nitrospirota bacterium]